MQKVLLTGGAGFLGSHIAVALVEQGYEPLIVDNFSNADRRVVDRLSLLVGKPLTVHEFDCRDTQRLIALTEDAGGVDGIVHLAAYKAVGESVKNPLKYYDNNPPAMMSALRVAERWPKAAFVLSSSCTVYGQPASVVVTEQTPYGDPFSPYGFTKQICERALSDFIAARGETRGVSLRYFNPIGAHPSGMIGEWPLGVPNNLVPFITQTAAGLRDMLTVFGDDYPTADGTCVRDFIHVCDLAEAHIAALNHALGSRPGTCEVYNVGTGKGVSVGELIDTFINETGQTLKLRNGPRRPGDVAAIYADVSKAEAELGWKAKYSPADALRNAWQWQQNLMTEK